jgi:hypothetical protein
MGPAVLFGSFVLGEAAGAFGVFGVLANVGVGGVDAVGGDGVLDAGDVVEGLSDRGGVLADRFGQGSGQKSQSGRADEQVVTHLQTVPRIHSVLPPE